ncbi:MAG: alpha/beta fold hydrolase, partial [Spirochaetes bacterium]|nr:alpha/beta fold hydrolase [Spirochaetota bacterium]
MTRFTFAVRGTAPRAAAAVLIAGAFTLLGGCVRIPVNEDTLFQPKESVTIGTFDHPEASLEEIFFESEDGTRVNAWHLSHPEARATVLLFGGYGFYLVQSRPYIDHFLEQGVNALLVDYRGYGRSEGEPTVAALKEDGLAAWETLTGDLGADPRTIVVHGHSLGTFMATYVAEQRE